MEHIENNVLSGVGRKGQSKKYSEMISTRSSACSKCSVTYAGNTENGQIVCGDCGGQRGLGQNDCGHLEAWLKTK